MRENARIFERPLPARIIFWLKSLWKEAHGDIIVDPLQNKYINFVYSTSEDGGDCKDVYIPSKRYEVLGVPKSHRLKLGRQLMSKAPSAAEGFLVVDR